MNLRRDHIEDKLQGRGLHPYSKGRGLPPYPKIFASLGQQGSHLLKGASQSNFYKGYLGSHFDEERSET